MTETKCRSRNGHPYDKKMIFLGQVRAYAAFNFACSRPRAMKRPTTGLVSVFR